jgi:hypothetical protein
MGKDLKKSEGPERRQESSDIGKDSSNRSRMEVHHMMSSNSEYPNGRGRRQGMSFCGTQGANLGHVEVHGPDFFTQ